MSAGVTVLVPGKVILSGEHSVVYGQPAMVAAVGRQMSISLEPAAEYELVSKVEDKLGLVRELLKKSGVDPDTVRVQIQSEIPAGMGTSAALCAGVIKAAHQFKEKELDQQTWYRLTWESEKKAHYNSSGVDPAAVIYGGLLWYVRGKVMEHLKIPKQYKLVLVDSGKPKESTGEMVSGLADRYALQKSKYQRLFEQTGKVTQKMREKMEVGEDIGQLINDNGKLLEEIGLVGGWAIKISEELRQLGYGVKITGAGGVKNGSGRLMVFGSSLDKIKQMGYEAFEVTVGEK